MKVSITDAGVDIGVRTGWRWVARLVSWLIKDLDIFGVIHVSGETYVRPDEPVPWTRRERFVHQIRPRP